ncbi:MAG: sugar porter family MFS transporter [Bacteroidales bacterium]|nr:sugar porter family MFS transporter [Bacteroidales bacterium]MDG1901774.1 sugar porter family MFS transporter [Bacteroidales bacterium]MDG2081340.1 sugar porter family MFS transporter [Bacteroidales bacterium]
MNNYNSKIIRISSIVALGGFLMGFDASVISGVIKFIEPEFGLSKLEVGWAVSCLTLTATIAMLIAGPLSDRYGRKKVLSMAAVVYAVSAIMSAVSPTFTFLIIARMIGGFGVGASLIVAPMYIAEIAPPKIRGTMVSFNQLNIVIGISVAFFTNYLILQWGKADYAWANTLMINKFNWRWMLGLELIPAILYFGALILVPRSPRWLVMKGNINEAKESLKKAGDNQNIEKEVEAISLSLKNASDKREVKLKEIFSPALRAVLVIGIVLAVLQQLTGINSVFFYAPMIFELSGFGVDASFSQAILVGLTNILFTILAMSLIDKIGRKLLLTIGVTGIAVSMFVLAYGFNSASYTVTDEIIVGYNNNSQLIGLDELKNVEFLDDIKFQLALQETIGKENAEKYETELVSKAISLNSSLILAAILTFVASFAVSIGPVMWVMFSELFPNAVRAVAISFVGFVNSVVSFIVQLIFPWELSNLGTSSTFLIYGLFAAFGLIFIIAKVPETKGKTLEELELILSNK